MIGEKTKKALLYFFLVSFALLRAANLHAVSHAFSDEAPQHCELCDLIAHSNEITLDLGPGQVAVPPDNPEFHLSGNGFEPYCAPGLKTLHFQYFYNKPPPGFSLG